MPADFVARFLRPLRNPPLTRRYPNDRPTLPLATRALPEIDPARCDASAACVEVCPTAAISLTSTSWTIDTGLCVFCGACELVCPRDAIRLGARFELAGRTRDGLRLSTPIGTPR